MIRQRLRANPLTLGLALWLELSAMGTALLILAPPIQAQDYVPPLRSAPGRRVGAGTRTPNDLCLQGGKLLMPLAPKDSFSATTSKTPVFFWFVPGTIAKTGEFKLLIDGPDNQQEELLTDTLPLQGTAGIVAYRLSDQASRLIETGKDYRWQFSLTCDPNNPSRNPFVEGVVQRVEPKGSLKANLQKLKSARDRASAYAAAGLWQDSITLLAGQRCAQPNDSDLKTSWNRLLKSVGLEAYAQAPLTQSCHLNTSKEK